MPKCQNTSYTCATCNEISSQKSHIDNHLKTEKHMLKETIKRSELEKKPLVELIYLSKGFSATLDKSLSKKDKKTQLIDKIILDMRSVKTVTKPPELEPEPELLPVCPPITYILPLTTSTECAQIVLGYSVKEPLPYILKELIFRVTELLALSVTVTVQSE